MAPRRNVSLKAIFALSVLLVASSFVYVAVAMNAIQNTTTILESFFGSYTNVTNSLRAFDMGVALSAQSVLPAGANSTSRVTFSPTPSVATDGITPGDWVLTILVNTTSTAPANANFTVNLVFSQGGSSTHFTVYLSTGSSVESGGLPFEILCRFDVGASLNSPYSFTFSIQ